MDDTLYNEIWAVLDPILGTYNNRRQQLLANPATLTMLAMAQANNEFVANRDAALAPFGVTWEEMNAELDRRLEKKYKERQSEKEELVKLREFFKEICDLTVNHDSISYSDGEKDHDYAVVFPNKLEESLIRVNPEWWKND